MVDESYAHTEVEWTHSYDWVDPNYVEPEQTVVVDVEDDGEVNAGGSGGAKVEEGEGGEGGANANTMMLPALTMIILAICLFLEF